MANSRDEIMENINNPLVERSNVLSQQHPSHMDLPSEINFSLTCKRNHAFFKYQVTSDELLKLIAAYKYKLEAKHDSENIHRDILNKVEAILKVSPQAALNKGNITLYSGGHLKAQIKSPFDETKLNEEESKELARNSFRIPKVYHETPFQCAFRTGNPYLYKLIYQYVKDLPNGISRLNEQIQELEAPSYNYEIVLWPTLGYGAEAEDLKPVITHIFILAENAELPADIPLNTLLFQVYTNLSGGKTLQVYQLEKGSDNILEINYFVDLDKEQTQWLDLFKSEKLRVITPDDKSGLFNKLLKLSNYTIFPLQNKVTLIKRYNDSFKAEFYLWAQANSKWQLTKLPADISVYNDLLKLPFPDCNGTAITIDSTKISNGIYEAFSVYHTKLFTLLNAVNVGLNYINKCVELGITRGSEGEKESIASDLWLEVGREEITFPVWFTHAWYLIFVLSASANAPPQLDPTQDFWELALNTKLLGSSESSMEMGNAYYTQNLGIYWTMQFFARTPGVILDRGPGTITSYNHDNLLLANFNEEINNQRRAFKTLLNEDLNQVIQVINESSRVTRTISS